MTKKPLNRRIVCEHHAFFDQFSKQYEKQLQKGLSLTGEDAGYYAMSRIKWLARCFQKIELQPKCILDFGCGIGNSIPYLLEYLRAVQVVGLDTSRASLDEARRRNPSTSVSLVHSDEFHDQSRYNLAFCNGVFHHIPPALRGDALRMIWNALKPGGLFAFWENNP